MKGEAMELVLDQGLRRAALGRKLRLGMVGGGRGGLVGHQHIDGARLSGQWEVTAGALSTNPANAAISATDYGIAPERSYDDYRVMAKAEAARPDGIEAVTICTPNWTHTDVALSFMREGIDVILDKPMTISIAEAEQLVAERDRSGVVLAMTYPYTHHAMVRQARLMVARGVIGKIRQVFVEYSQDWATADESGAFKGVWWRRDPAKIGRASATGDIGTHAYHLLKYVTGLEVDSLRADFHVCGAPKAMEDTAHINVRMEGGAPGVLWITQAAPGNACGLRMRIYGEKGGLTWDQEYPEDLHLSLLDAPEQILRRGKGGGMYPEAERLVHTPRGCGEALTDAWGNLYAEIGLQVAARRNGLVLPQDQVEVPDAADGLAGVRFVERCADSHEAGGLWQKLAG